MNNLVKINYKGKELIGEINNIDSTWSNSGYTANGRYDNTRVLQYYKVSLLERDTDLRIDNIILHDISQIEILRGDNNE